MSDTKFWGPSAWKLLHCITYKYNPATQKKYMARFLSLLPFVLPCKFCRKSLTEYFAILPFTTALSSQKALSAWMYKVHNKVNEKLKSQGLPVAPIPTLKEVNSKYESYLEQGCSRTVFLGWEFLFSILDNHPYSKEGQKTTPFECPAPPVTDIDKNRFNTLTPDERIPYIIAFFEVLPRVLPYKEWEESWGSGCDSDSKYPCKEIAKGRRQAIAWLWKIRRGLEADFDLQNKDTFLGLCQTVASHRSGCSKSSRAITCRRKRSLKQ